MMKRLGIVCLLVLLNGCETTSGLSSEGEIAYFEAQQAMSDQPLFELSCPDQGCVVGSLKVNNPQQNQINALQTQNPGVELARTAADIATAVVPWFVVGDIATTGIRNAGSVTNTDSRSTDNSQRSMETTDIDNSQRSVSTDIDNSQRRTVTTQPTAKTE